MREGPGGPPPVNTAHPIVEDVQEPPRPNPGAQAGGSDAPGPFTGHPLGLLLGIGCRRLTHHRAQALPTDSCLSPGHSHHWLETGLSGAGRWVKWTLGHTLLE